MSNVLSRLLLKASGVAVRPLQLIVGSGLSLVDNKDGTATLARGTIATADLGSGAADSTTFLRGDQSWAAPAGGTTPGTFDITVSNNTGSTIAAGKAVSWNDNVTAGAPHAQFTAGNADTPGEGTPLGITTTSIAAGGTGTVRVFGVVTGLDTHTFSVGDDVQGGTSGVLEAYSNGPWLGLVLVSDASAGQVFVGNTLIAKNSPVHSHSGNQDGGAINGNMAMIETTTPSNPPSGQQYVYIDSVDHKLKRVNSTGTVTIIG